MDEQQEREQRGIVIAATAKLQKSGDRWFVPSQTSKHSTFYEVRPDQLKPYCSCPDFTARQRTRFCVR